MNARRDKHACCGFCGAPFSSSSWPRVCGACAQTTYRNPTPVVVLLLPVADDDGEGVLCVRRGLPDGRGLLALPGGYIDFGESWQQAAARELVEETSIVIAPERVSLLAVHSAETTLLVFARGPLLPSSSLPPFQPTAETTERVIVRAPVELAFPLHTQVLREHFSGGR